MKPANLADVFIHMSECLKEVEGIEIDWRVLYKYFGDYLTDRELNCQIIELDSFQKKWLRKQKK